MTKWIDFMGALGETEQSPSFLSLLSGMSGAPEISATPTEYNDPEGETKFYQFFGSGIELGFRCSTLSHIHFFLVPREGFAEYLGPFPNGIRTEMTIPEVIQQLGTPTREGGGKAGSILASPFRWIRFDGERHALRCEFSEKGRLHKLSLMKL